MRKSNKLLLIGFLGIIVLITALHLTLYAKYKNGDYTLFHVDNELPAQAMQMFPGVLFVNVQNVNGATVKFSDVAAVEKTEEDQLRYVQKGDTLFITQKKDVDHEDFGYPLEFHVPDNARINLLNSSLSFVAGKKIGEGNLVIYLQKSNVTFSGKGNSLRLGNVKAVALDSSAVLFFGNTQVNSLDVQLANSSLEYGEGNFNQLSITTDSVSRISLQSKHLLKANIKTLATQ